MGSTDRPPNALSLRFSSMRVVLSLSASQIADKASGISEIRRPVNMSAKSAIYKAMISIEVWTLI